MLYEEQAKLNMEFQGRLYTYLNQQSNDRIGNAIRSNMIQVAASNAALGCYWGIIEHSKEDLCKELNPMYSKIKNMPNYRVWRIKDNTGSKTAYLIEIDKDLMEDILVKTVDASLWNQNVLNRGYNNRLANAQKLDMYLKELRRHQNSQDYIICIYNTNKDSVVKINKEIYHSFAVNIYELLLLAYNNGFFIVPKGLPKEYAKYEGMRISPIDLMQDNYKSLLNIIMENTRYTPGGNAVQIQISMATDKELRKPEMQRAFDGSPVFSTIMQEEPEKPKTRRKRTKKS